jgi:NADP-dependent 3-hydroxy acid dehydrogenase YdfG
VIGFNPGGFKSRILEKVTGVASDLSAYMMAEDVATALIQTLELPKNMEVSQIIINRK